MADLAFSLPESVLPRKPLPKEDVLAQEESVHEDADDADDEEDDEEEDPAPLYDNEMGDEGGNYMSVDEYDTEDSFM